MKLPSGSSSGWYRTASSAALYHLRVRDMASEVSTPVTSVKQLTDRGLPTTARTLVIPTHQVTGLALLSTVCWALGTVRAGALTSKPWHPRRDQATQQGTQ